MLIYSQVEIISQFIKVHLSGLGAGGGWRHARLKGVFDFLRTAYREILLLKVLLTRFLCVSHYDSSVSLMLGFSGFVADSDLA